MRLCPLCKRSWEDDFRVCPIDGLALQAVEAETDPFAGKTLGALKISEKIADGDLGPIYRAEDPTRGAVAIQYINQDRVASPVLMEAFEDAVNLAAKLIHPHVLRVYSLERAPDGTVAVVMEYVAGSSLRDYRASHPALDWTEACALIKQAADGLSAAHRTSMLHGSVHPTRIIVGADGVVKVAGFHRSGLRDVAGSSGAKPGELVYWSPEQLGIIRDVPYPDYRADVYGLGVTLYELLAGRLPYEAKSVEDLAAVMDAGPALPPSFANPQVSPTLSRVVLKAISKQPVDRHRSMEEFLRELEAASQPFREPERHEPELPRSPEYPPARGDSGLFPPSGPTRGRESVENIWPEAAHAPHAGESSMFTWFKTRIGGGKQAPARKKAPAADDSFFSSRKADDGDERTAIATGARRRSGRRRSFAETFTNFGRRDDVTGTDFLPRRRFSSRAYVLMGVGGLLLVGAVVTLILMFGRASSGKLMLESNPPGAQIFLNDEYRGNTPLLIPEIKADAYRLRLQLDGYEAVAATVEVGPDKDVQRAFVLNRLAPIQLPAPPPLPSAPTEPSAAPVPVAAPAGAKAPYEAMFNNALRSRNLFPPAPGSAWDVLQTWQQREAASPTAALEQARQSFCREVETVGLEKLDQRDFQSVRGLLEQIRTRMPGQPCGGGLQARYDAALSRSIADLRAFTSAAMNRQNYVTPEADNALKYVRLILQIDPQDGEAKALDGELFQRGLEQAKAKAEARQHQDALAIYTQLKAGYPNPPGGVEPLNQGIEREKRRMALAAALKVPYSVAVKHGHSFLRIKNRDCTGVLRADGFSIEFQTNGDHGFKLAYDVLKSVSYGKGKIVIEGSTIGGGKIELEQTEKNPSPSLADLYGKIEEYRKLRAEYLRP